MYLVFSSFYAFAAMRTLKGEPTGALYGFINRLESLLEELEPKQVIVAFDAKEKTFRHQLLPQYKAKRLKPPQELLEQIPLIKTYLSLRGVPFYEQPGLEADDIIAALSYRSNQQQQPVIIFTADKDLFQLVFDQIFIYHPKLKQKMTAEDIKNHFGVYPQQIVDFLSLTGDSSDNIPGVPGIGEKTALNLIEKYHTLDQLLAQSADLPEKIRQKIQANLEILALSKKLIDLTPSLTQSLDFSPAPFKNTITPELLDFYQRFSFQSLLKKYKTEETAVKEEQQIAYRIVRTLPELEQLQQKIIQVKSFTFDIETTDLQFYLYQLVGLSIYVDQIGYYIPFLFQMTDAWRPEFTLNHFKQLFADIFKNPDIKKNGHNIKFDCLGLKSIGLEVNGIAHDSMVMSYLLHANRRSHKLKELSLEYLNYKQTEYEELVGKGKNKLTLADLPIEKTAHYCIDDAAMTDALVAKLKQPLVDNQLDQLYANVEMPLLTILMEMEYIGFKVDANYLRNAVKTFTAGLQQSETYIFQLAGQTFNINSSTQLGELLFEKMNLPMKKRTQKTKSYSTDSDVLNELRQFPIVEEIIKYRTYKKILSTYLLGLLEYLDDNSRIHSSLNQTVTATGRLSSSNPNLQNIPLGEIFGVNVRQAFVASPGMVLIAADYSQIELRVMAHFSEDKNLMEAFQNNLDIHQYTADLVFGQGGEISAQQKRKRAKIINFSILYGSGAYSLSKELQVGFSEAKQFIDMYFERYQGVKSFMEQVIERTAQNPWVETILGRKRNIPEIQSDNKSVQENGRRMAINSIIQGSAADIIKMAMIKIDRQMKKNRSQSRMLLQIHDELLFECPPAEAQDLIQVIKSEMEGAIALKVPLTVSIKQGPSWGNMQPFGG
jgi:DNA polymerase-1